MSINVTVSGTSVGVNVSAGIGPAGFITAPGTATNLFGTLQFTPSTGITVSTTSGQFIIATYDTTTIRNLSSVMSVAGRTGTVTLTPADVGGLHAVAVSGSYTSLNSVPLTFAPAAHTHDAAEVASGTLAIGRIPTISYTALSNVPTTFAPATHTHDASSINAGTLAIGRIPTGTSSSSVCIGNDARLSDARPISWTSVPASATATGTQGSVAYDTDYVYVSVGTNSWKRLTLATW